MARRDIAERMLAFTDAFQWRQGFRKPAHQLGGGGEIALGKTEARIGAVQVGPFLAPIFLVLRAKGFECLGQPRSAGTRTRATQDRAFKRPDGSCVVSRTQSQQRMFEQAEQRHRRQIAERSVGGKPGKNAGGRIGKPFAAGVLGGDIPAIERRLDAARQRPVGRHQRRGRARLHRLAQRDRDGERLVFGVGGFDHGDRAHGRLGMRLEARICGARPPQIGRRRRPQHF